MKKGLLALGLWVVCTVVVLGLAAPSWANNALAYKGAWYGNTNYAFDTIVTYKGSSWVSLRNLNRGHAPDVSPNWWG